MVNFSNVVHSGYCCSSSTNLWIDMEQGVALNDNNEVIFRMEKHFSHGRRRILQDASSKSICTLHKKKVTGHGRWEVFKGDDTSRLSFIIKRPTVFTEENIVLEVFLANNPEESVCKVNACRGKNSCEIFTRQSTLARAYPIMDNKDAMMVEITAAGIDVAFIVAVLMIVDEKKINKFKKLVKRAMT